MRQPVAGVLALAGAALTEPGLPRSVHARLEQIVQQAEWLADMIQNWLHAAQPGTPDARADLATIISEAVAAECVTNPVEVNVLWPAEPVHVSVHPVILRLVVDDSGPGFGKLQEGLGIGLRAAARNVVNYGGRLECGCGALGGARVSLWLPLSACRPQVAPPWEHLDAAQV